MYLLHKGFDVQNLLGEGNARQKSKLFHESKIMKTLLEAATRRSIKRKEKEKEKKNWEIK